MCKKIGLVKDDGKINWKTVGIAVSLFVMVLLYILLLAPQLIPFFNFMDKQLWFESVKFCIDKWTPIASVECGGMALMGALNKKEDSKDV